LQLSGPTLLFSGGRHQKVTHKKEEEEKPNRTETNENRADREENQILCYCKIIFLLFFLTKFRAGIAGRKLERSCYCQSFGRNPNNNPRESGSSPRT
jgi:hypothetical protein